MAMIELSDDHAAALTAKAAAQGLTLQNWLGKLAEPETLNDQSEPRKGRYRLDDLMAQCDLNVPLTPEDRAWLDTPAVGREAKRVD